MLERKTLQSKLDRFEETLAVVSISKESRVKQEKKKYIRLID